MGGGDKCLLKIAGRSILDHILERLRPQANRIILNANGDPDRFAAFGLPVIPDTVTGFAGPLAGVLAGMEWTRKNAPTITDIVTIPCDGPFIPRDFIARMRAGRDQAAADIACAASLGRACPVAGLWPVRLANDLRFALTAEHIHKVDVWTARYSLVQIPFEADPVDPFFNANEPEDLVTAARLLGQAS